MPKLIDLTGQRFGRWTVLKKAESKNKTVYWLCQCDCGTIKQVRGRSLRQGKSKSCGCLHKELSKKICSNIGKNNIKDLTGQKFGDWTVLKDSGRRSSNGAVIWTCQCSCGTIRDVKRESLETGYSKNCGCKIINSKGELYVSELLKENNIPFEVQKTFKTCFFQDTNRLARFDFYIDNKYLVEYDGELHYNYGTGWATEEKMLKIQQHDKIKNQWCKQNNIPLIRIPYTHLKDLCIEDLLLETSKFIV